MSASGSRRHFIRSAAGVTVCLATGPTTAQPATGKTARRVDIVASAGPSGPGAYAGQPVRAEDFSMVGVYDVDWLLEPGFQRLLDNMAASPGAFRTVRFFGALSSGTLERNVDRDPPAGAGGSVWPRADAPVDFAATFEALEALTSRGLIPFVVLSFFPPAVSSSGVLPPASFASWKRLVRGFLDQLIADPRFGPGAIRDWWFEVWNEPNMGGFWRGSFAQYLDLYRATSDAVIQSRHDVRLGGPALAYLPDDAGPDAGAPLMRAFLRFLSEEPGVKCDFISLHRKGAWSEREPDLASLATAAEDTARTALAIDPERFRGIPIVNDEADMKVGFDIPYEPRMDERFPAWLSAVAIACAGLSSRYASTGQRFLAAADDANLQLVRAPFDGRRSIMTRASPAPRDLFKVPAYGFYEMLRLLGDRHGAVVSGSESCFPNSDLFHAITVADGRLTAIFTIYPRNSDAAPRPCRVEYTIVDIPWPRVNVARFQIGAVRSNAYRAAGGALGISYPSVLETRAIRRAQELTTLVPIERNLSLRAGEFRLSFDIEPFTTLCCWITPVLSDVPADPAWLEAAVEDDNAILRWTPSLEPFFYSYELYRMVEGQRRALLSPVPLRAAMWVDTAPRPGEVSYGVRAVSASGVASTLVETAV